MTLWTKPSSGLASQRGLRHDPHHRQNPSSDRHEATNQHASGRGLRTSKTDRSVAHSKPFKARACPASRERLKGLRLRGCEVMQVVLPWPPTANTYWRHPTTGKLAGRHLISEKGRDYREAVRSLVAESRLPCIAGPLCVVIEAFPPDKRRRDLDNLLKSLFDSLTHAGVWLDDSQVDDLRIFRSSVGGMVKVTITPGPNVA